MLTNRQIENRIRKIEALEEQIEALKEQADEIKDELKAELTERNIEVLETENGKVVRYQFIGGWRFDSKRFKKEMPDMYNDYLTATSSFRFTIA